MHQDLFIRGEKYISVQRAAEITGYTRDYIGQLCRGNKVDASRVGRIWFVSEGSLLYHKNLYSQKTYFSPISPIEPQEPKEVEPTLPPVVESPESLPIVPVSTESFVGAGSFLNSFRGELLFEKMTAFFAIGVISAGLFFYFNPEKTNVFAQTANAMASGGARAYELLSSSFGKVSGGVSSVLGDGFKSISKTFSDKKEEANTALASFRNSSAQESFARMVTTSGSGRMTIRPLPTVISESENGKDQVAGISFRSSPGSLKRFFEYTGETIARLVEKPSSVPYSVFSSIKKGAELNMKSVNDLLSSLEFNTKNGILALKDSVSGVIGTMFGSLNDAGLHIVRNSPPQLASPLASVGSFFTTTSLGVYHSVNNFFCTLFCNKTTPPSVFVVDDPTPPSPQLKKQIVEAPVALPPQTNVVERVVERVVVQSPVASTDGVSRGELDQRLQELNNKLSAEIYKAAPRDDNYFQYFSPALPAPIQYLNNVDNLSGTIITNPSISGGTWSNVDITSGSGSFTTLSASSFSTGSGVFNSGVTIGGNLTVSGTGTSTFAGDVAFDSNTLYIDSLNNRVGIATSSPSDTFSLNGPLYFTQISAPSVSTNRLYNLSGDLYWAGSVIGGATTGQWTTDGTHVWRPGGNVGIGTTSPYAKLSVVGQTVSTYFTATSTTATSTFAGGLAIGTSTPPAGSLFTVGTSSPLFHIDRNSGNVGIGITQPSELLQLHSASTASIQITNNNAGTSQYNGLGLGIDNTIAWVWNYENLPLQFATNDQERMRITAGGFVGIGTTTPNWLLQAAGTRPFLALSDTSASTDLKHWLFSSQGGNLYVSTSSDAYATSTTINALTILNNGRVGIGTSTPGARFDVASRLQGGTDFKVTRSNTISSDEAVVRIEKLNNTAANNDQLAILDFYGTDSAGNTQRYAFWFLTALDVTDGSEDGRFTFNGPVNGSSREHLRLDDQGVVVTAGNFGVGITSPFASIHTATTSGRSLILEDSGGATGLKSWLFSSQKGSLFISTSSDAYATSTPPVLSLLNSGRVGIGSSSPSAKLSVHANNGDTNLSLFQIGSSTASATSTLFTVLNSGSVGIGVTNPNGLLNINQSYGTPSLRLSLNGLNHGLTNVDPATTYGRLDAESVNGGVYFNGITTATDDSAFIIHGLRSNAGDAGVSTVAIVGSGRSGANTAALSDSETIFAIINNWGPNLFNVLGSGSVGIGTTSPYAKLSVVGQIVGNYFTATSTTIASIFPYASTTALTISGTAYIGSLTGPLQAVSGVVSASSTLSVAYGGTGLSTLPSYGQLLLGNASSGYTLTATSSLGFLGSNFTDWRLTTNIFAQSALTSTTTQNILVSGVGTSTFAGGLEVWRQIAAPYFHATGTAATSTFAGGLVVDTNTLVVDYSGGKVGIGLTNPTQALDVVGNITNTGSLTVDNDSGAAVTISSNSIATSICSINNGGQYIFTCLAVSQGTTDIRASARFLRTQSSTGSITGVETTGTKSGDGNSQVNYGVNANLSFTGTSGTDTSGYGVYGSGTLNGSGYTLTTAVGVYGKAFTVTAGTVTNNWAGFFEGNLGVSGSVGVATTTPWAKLSVGTHNLAIATPSFVIASSSTGVATTTQFIVVNGNVGIGTTSPYTKFDVVNSGNELIFNDSGLNGSANYLTLKAISGSNGQSGLNLKIDNTNLWQLLTDNNMGGVAQNAFFIQNGNNSASRYLTVLTGGNVGIGTTSPYAKLSVHANNGETNTTLFNISSSTASATTSLFTVFNTGSVAIGTSTPPASNLFTVGTSTPILYVDRNSGRVGINTASPTADLDIRSHSSTYSLTYGSYTNDGSGSTGGLILTSNGNDNPAAVFNQNNAVVTAGPPLALHRVNTNGIYLTTTGTNENLIVQPSGTGAIVLTRDPATGKVGLGTTSPFAKLSVAGGDTSTTLIGADAPSGFSGNLLDLKVASTTVFSVNQLGNITSSGSFTLSGLGANMLLTSDGSGTIVSSSTPTAARYIATSTTATSTFAGGLVVDTNTLVVDYSSNKVGIGTTSPDNALDVLGYARIGNVSDVSLTLERFTDNTGFASVDYVTAGARSASNVNWSAGLLENSNDYSIWSYDGSSNISRLTIKNTGNVGVATSTPWARLSVGTHNLAIATPSFVIASSSTGVATTTQFIVVNGNVGIGTTSPWAQFSVNPNALGSGVPEFVIGSSTATHFIVDGSGNVGIGTTSPVKTLVITGTARISDNDSGATFDFFANDTGSNSQLFIDSPTGVDNIIVKFFRNTNTSSNKSVIFSRGDGTDTAHAQIGVDGVNSFFQIGGGNFGIGTSTPWAKFSLAAVAANTSPLFSISTSTANSTSTAFHIDSNGKVGIGTSSPYTQLSVQGGIAGQFYNADATTSTSTFAGGLNIANGALQYDYSAGLTTIENLALGALSFDTDAGIVTWVDMPVTSSATVGTVESYTARIDGNALLTVYAESDGAGGIQNSRVGIGTTTPQYFLTVATSTGPQLSLSAGAGVAQWAFRNAGGNLYIATTTVAGTATTSISALEIAGSGFGTTTVRGLNIIGQATTTSNVGYSITTGCYAIGVTCISAGSGTPAGNSTQLQYNNAGSFGGAEIFYTSSSGNLGISTSSPWAELSVGTHNLALATPSFVIASSSTGLATTTQLIVVNGKVGVGATTSPWGLLSVNPNALGSGVPEFVVGSSTATHLIVDGSGRVGIGTTTPLDNLEIVTTGSGGLTITDRGSFGTSPNITLKHDTGSITVNNEYLGQISFYGRESAGNAFQGALIESRAEEGGWGSNFGRANLKFFTLNGTTLTEWMRIMSTGNIGFATTTPQWLLNPFSSTAAQLSLSAGAGIAQWTFRNAGGNLYIATTTVAGTATTSISALEISGSGFGTTTVRGLNIIGFATSTSNVGYSITSGCYAIGNTCISSGGAGTPSGNSTQLQYNNTGAFGGAELFYTSSSGNLGVATSSPWARLSVGTHNQALATPSFVIASSSTGVATTTQFIVKNGNVGIGTSTPGEILDISGSATTHVTAQVTNRSTTGYSEFLARNNANGAGGIAVYGTGDSAGYANNTFMGSSHDLYMYTNFSVQNGGTGALRFMTGGWDVTTQQRMIIGSTGLVGIGTSTPQYLLTISSTTAPQLSLSAGAGVAQWTFRNAGGNLYLATTTVAGTATTSSSAVTINGSNGNVGIGMTNPVAALHVGNAVAVATPRTIIVDEWSSSGGFAAYSGNWNSPSRWGLGPVSNSTTDSTVQLGIVSDQIGTWHGTQNLNFVVGGKIGIGTTTPQWTLNPFSATAPQLSLSAGAGVSQWTFRNAGGNLYLATTTVAGTATTSTSALTIIGSTGNVGIGTTSPSGLFHVEGPGTPGTPGILGINLLVTTSNTADTYNLNVDTLGGAAERIIMSAEDATYRQALVFSDIGGSDTTKTIFGISSSQDSGASWQAKLTVSHGGNVGIGTTTPWAKLAISVVAANTSPLFSISTSTASGTSTAFHIDSNGKVGVGTSSPYTQLSVQGGIAGQFYNADATTSTSTFSGGLNVGSGALQYDFSTGVTTLENAQFGATSFDANVGMVSWIDLPVTSSASSGIVESYTAQIDGNPLLTVYAESDGTGGIRNSRIGVATTTPQWTLSVFATSTPQLSLSAGAGVAQWAFRNAGGNLYIATTTVAGTATTSTSVLTIIGSTGNVGIGTTSPWRTLSASGTVAFAGLTTAAGSPSTLCLDATTKEVLVNAAATCTVSSERYKHDITDLNVTALELLSQINPSSFIYNGTQRTRWGFIAENLASTSPFLAEYDGEGRPNSVDLMGVLAIVVKSLQELTDKVNTLAQGAVGQVGAIGAGIFERLTVGSSDRPIGITLYDEVTGVAHCLKVRNGITITSAGVCPDAQAPENQNNNPENPPTEEPTTDTTPPTITINGNNPANIFVGSVYADLGAIFSDNIDQNLTTYTFLNGATTTDVVIDTATAGTHTVTYTAQDDEGNTASAERIVIVEQQAVVPEVPPEVPPQETP